MSSRPEIPFHKPMIRGRERAYLEDVLTSDHWQSNGVFSRRCADLISAAAGGGQVLPTQSCSDALEIAARLCGLHPGDEVVMPSFTFPTTAAAFIRCGAVPVFVDIDQSTLTLDPDAVASAVGPRTRAIVPVHYAGVSCDLDRLGAIAGNADLTVVEDAAQGLGATCRNRPLGSFGTFGTVSFHGTKNLSCGEGGALIINDATFVHEAEMFWMKGTNFLDFKRGKVSRYQWQCPGSAHAISEISAAILCAQLETHEAVTAERRALWERYHTQLAPLETAGVARRPGVPAERVHNGHIYYLICDSETVRDSLIEDLATKGIQATFHYMPLHSSPAGREYCRTQGALPVTETAASRIIRLPLWTGMTDQPERVADAVLRFFGQRT